MNRIVLDGREITYELRCSRRAKNARIEILAALGLVVVAPGWVSWRELEAFMLRKRRWILHGLDRMSSLPCKRPNGPLKAGDEVLYLGERKRLVVLPTEDRRPSVN